MIKKELAIIVGVIATLLFVFNSNADAVLVGWWKMDDNIASGQPYDTKVEDFSGNDYHGTLYDPGTPGQYTKAHHAGSGNPPYLNGALTFDGTDDYVEVGDIGNFSAMTWELWIYREAGSGLARIVSRNSAMGSYTRAIDIIGSGALKWKVCLTTTDATAESSTTIATDTWYHVAGVFDGTTAKLFINGVQDGEGAGAGSLHTPAEFYMGRLVSGGITYYGFNGIIDDVRIYNEALSDTVIKSHYNNAMIPEPSALLLLGAGLLGILVFRPKR